MCGILAVTDGGVDRGSARRGPALHDDALYWVCSCRLQHRAVAHGSLINSPSVPFLSVSARVSGVHILTERAS